MPAGSASRGEPQAADLTARARIRDAALRLFAERGVQAASIRDIAAEAGVSPALVRHHYGSKETLRDICDAYAVDQLVALKTAATPDGRLVAGPDLFGLQPAIIPLVRYIARALIDGSPGAALIFDRMVQRTEDWLLRFRPGLADDPRAFAAVLVAQNAGLHLLREHVSRTLGVDLHGPVGSRRLALTMLDLHGKPLLDADEAAAVKAAVANGQTEAGASGESQEEQE